MTQEEDINFLNWLLHNHNAVYIKYYSKWCKEGKPIEL